MKDRLARVARSHALAPAALALGLAVQVAVLSVLARRMWFYNDDWVFLVGRDLGEDPIGALFRPHNDHWSTLPLIAFRLMFHFYGLQSYLPYAMMPIAAHVAICVLLYLLLRRAGVEPWVGVISTLAVAFLAGGAGAENTLWDFQVGFLGACFFGLVALLALDGGRRSQVVGLVLLVLSLMCAGIGLVMVGWATVWALLRHGVKRAVVTAVFPAAVYVVWYVTFGRDQPSFYPDPDPATAPFGAVYGLANVWSAATSMEGAGPAVLAAMVAAVVLPRHGDRLFALAASGLITMVLAYALFGFSRSGIGNPTQTAVSRYVYFGVLFCGPALACLVTVLARHLGARPWAGVLAGLLAVSSVVTLGSAQAIKYADQRERIVGGFKEQVVAGAHLIRQDAPLLGDTLDPRYNRGLTVDRLRPVLDRVPRLEPQPVNALQAAAELQVALSRAELPTPYAEGARVIWSPGERKAVPLGGCVTGYSQDGRIEVPVTGRGAQVSFFVPGTGGTEVRTRLLRDGVTSGPRVRAVSKGASAYVGSTAPGATLFVSLPDAQVTVCAAPEVRASAASRPAPAEMQ